MTTEHYLLTFNRMLADAEYFNSRIGKLEGAVELGSHIVEIVKNKTIIAESVSQPTRPETDASTEKDLERAANGNGEQEKT